MGSKARGAVALAFALFAGAGIFLLSAYPWGRSESRKVRVKFDGGPRLLKLEGEGRDDRFEYVAAPDSVFREARAGDEVRATVRRIPEFEVESVEYRLVRRDHVVGRWSEGGVFFWLACGGLSLLSGVCACWIVAGLLRAFSASGATPPETRIFPVG